jgi:two-component system chemotaxis response regulator CheB
MPKPGFIIVVGTSAGGMNALSELVSYFDPKMNAAVFIVMHLAETSVSDFLLLKLQPHTSFKTVIATDEMPIERGTIYIAPANGHLVVDENVVMIGNGPRENRWKPSIDVMFRSAAASWSNRVTAIILTGLLDDGTVGMKAVQKSLGICIVQDPNEAEYPDMPVSVLNHLQPDHCLCLHDIGNLLIEITTAVPAEIIPAPPEVIMEANIAANTVISYDIVEKIGQKSQYACPDCGGGLYVMKETGMPQRYRCHIGHAYTEKELAMKQAETLESTLWVALRIMEERRTLLKKLELNNGEKGFKKVAAAYYQKAVDIERHIEKLKEILFSTKEGTEL